MLDNKLKRKLNALKMVTQDSEFTYEPPEMIYDKKTGDVQILPKKIKKKNTLIRSHDDLQKEKAALYAELGVEDYNDLDTSNMEEAADKVYKAEKHMQEDFDYDTSNQYVFTRDLFRVDVGLMIMRPPIFMHMREPDINMMKLRSKVMNEYYCDHKKWVNEFAEASQLNESVLSDNPYASDMNLDNHPTHEWTDPSSGETLEYCAASKNFANVDPNCSDPRSLHYAAEDRTYFIVRNRFTEEWQFPVGQLLFGQSFMRGK